MSYSSFENDRLEPANKLRIDRKIYFEQDETGISELTALPLEQLRAMREESAAAEQAVFERLQQQSKEWEEQAGKTLLIDKAIEYARTPEAQHTSNQWEQPDEYRHVMSNMVYRMQYQISENTRYDREAQKSIPYSWTLSWSIYTNSPDGYGGAKIAGQSGKVFGTKEEMEKYLNGRIKAYKNLFTEISPPIPQEYAKHFKVNGLLLPGYTIEGETLTMQQEPPVKQSPPQQEPPVQQEQTPEKKEEAAPEPETAEQQPEPEPPPQPRPVNPIILTADKPAEKIKEITDRLEQGITELFDSERYKEYLQVMSKFHNYSFNNTLLIAMQKPDASLIAGFNAWKNNFGRNVMRGEKGIRILAPSPYKIRQEVEKKDPQTGKTVIGSDGKPVMETKEIQIPAYKVVAVFDVSQTEGRELPTIGANELTGDVEQYEDFFAALKKTSPAPMGFEKIEGTAHGYYHLEEKRIAIDEGMSELQNLKTAIHEIAHAKLHDIDLNVPQEEQGDRPDRRTREVQAESIAYTVCQHYGLDTSDYSFGYVAGWSSGRELAELKTSLETIRSTAAEIINSIDGHFAELQKEREAAKEQEAGAQTPPDLSAEPTVTILLSESSQLREGETIPLSRANTLITELDKANLESPGYDKVEFRIDYVMNGKADQYEGRQDLGDGEGALIEHIEQYHAYYANDPDWNNFLLQHEGKEALEADKEHRAFLLNEFVPYLKLHCNLSEMERIAGEALQKDNLTPTETAYHTAMQAYVSECRGLINQGEYNLPPVPQLADFDVELQAYKEHVKEEIAQEAATAGMTVEEYAANGYEPYTTPELETTQTAEPQEPGDASMPETFCKVRQNPYSDSRENSHILQEYIAQDNGMAKLGDILYIGTPEKCRELLGKLEAGELTQGDVKELYAKAQEAQPTAELGHETPEPAATGKEPDKDTFSIYQLKRGDETRDYRFEPYDRLQAAGLCVDPANYDLIYTAPLAPDMTLEDISIRFNIDHPADFKGHSLSTSDVVVLHQNGQDTAHYADSYGYREVPEFLQEQTQQLTPDTRMTGEQIRTPRGSFSVTDMTAEQMRAAGYGLHHTSEDGKYLIMGNGTQAFAVAAEQPEKANPLKHVEDTIEQNDNNFDGIINNTPTADELEAKARSGEQISLSEYAAALKAEQEQGKEKKPGKKTEKKPSIRAQLKADKERAAQKKQTRSKSQDLERS